MDQGGHGVAVADVDEHDAGFPAAGLDGRVGQHAEDGRGRRVGHGAAAQGLLEFGQPGQFDGRRLVDQGLGAAVGLAQEALPETEPAFPAAFAGVQAVILGAGHVEVGFGQSGCGEEGLPGAGIEIGQEKRHGAGRAPGGDGHARGRDEPVGIVGQGPHGVGMGGQGQAGLEVGAKGLEKAASHIVAAQIDGAAGGGQFGQPGRDETRRRGQHEFRAVLGFQVGIVIVDILGAGTDVQAERAIGHSRLLACAVRCSYAGSFRGSSRSDARIGRGGAYSWNNWPTAGSAGYVSSREKIRALKFASCFQAKSGAPGRARMSRRLTVLPWV